MIVYHIYSDCFNSYKDCYKLIEQMLQDFLLFALGNLNHLGIVMYTSFLVDLYKYIITISLRYISSPTVKLIKN